MRPLTKHLRLWAFILAGLAGASSARADEPQTLIVFAAASLTEAFTEVGHLMEQRDPPVKVSFNFAGSQQLATQLEQGARADVFASADQTWMSHVEARQLLAAPARTFARNRLAVVLPTPNPAGIERLQDLARPGTKIVMAAEAVPVGRYSREVLAKISQDPAFGAEFSPAVLRNVVSQEENVKAVLAKVQLGEADAGIVYRSDVTAAVDKAVRVLDIPSELNVAARYPIAILKGSENPSAAAQFVDLILSPAGQAVFQRWHFVSMTDHE